MLEINNISFSYSRRRPEVLKDFSLRVEPGSIYGLLGPNGAGKSTLLYIIMGVLRAKTGSVMLDGELTSRRAPSTLQRMMIVPEEITLPAIDLEKYVALNSCFYPRFSMEVMEECLREFEIGDVRRLDRLSMGQKKKVYMSFALACNTDILLMDEPTNGLDIPGKGAFRRLCARLMTDDRVFLISTHQVRDLEQLLDEVLIMNERSLVFDRSVSEIQRRLRFERNAGREVADRAIYSQPSPGGYDVMLPNEGDDETVVNLELLFDYALKEPSKLNETFNEAR